MLKEITNKSMMSRYFRSIVGNTKVYDLSYTIKDMFLKNEKPDFPHTTITPPDVYSYYYFKYHRGIEKVQWLLGVISHDDKLEIRTWYDEPDHIIDKHPNWGVTIKLDQQGSPEFPEGINMTLDYKHFVEKELNMSLEDFKKVAVMKISYLVSELAKSNQSKG